MIDIAIVTEGLRLPNWVGKWIKNNAFGSSSEAPTLNATASMTIEHDMSVPQPNTCKFPQQCFYVEVIRKHWLSILPELAALAAELNLTWGGHTLAGI